LKTLRADLSILTVAALTGLAALGCSSTRACNPDTLFVTVTFNDATKNADTLQVNVNIDGGTTKTTMLTHKPGDTSGSVEVYFPTGYPKGKMVSVTIVALDGQATVGSATAISDALPDGCATLSIKFGGSSGTAGSGGGGVAAAPAAAMPARADAVAPEAASAAAAAAAAAAQRRIDGRHGWRQRRISGWHRRQWRQRRIHGWHRRGYAPLHREHHALVRARRFHGQLRARRRDLHGRQVGRLQHPGGNG
jgi:hypothetical protein